MEWTFFASMEEAVKPQGNAMTRIIAISNPKGGVGKTTTTINLAASLAIAEKNVLIIDMDPSGAVSTGVGLHRENIRAGIFEIFSGAVRLWETIHPLDFLNIDLIPSNVYTTEQDTRLSEMAKNRIRLKRQLNGLVTVSKMNYDYVLIDTPPMLNDLTLGALLAADSVLIPLQCGYFALKALDRLTEIVERIKKSANPNLEIEGILLNFYEKGTRASLKSASLAKRIFGDLVFKTIIPKNAAIGFAAFQHKPLALVDVTAPGSKAFLALAEEIIRKSLAATLLPQLDSEVDLQFAL